MSAPLHQRRSDRELAELKSRLGRIGGKVRRAIEQAAEATVARDEEQLFDVILGDHPINREIRKLDAATHEFVAVHLPAAASLRTVSSILRLNIALERIGDYAVTIGRAGVHLSSQPDAWLVERLRALAKEAVRMLDLAVRAFVEDDVDLAQRTMDIGPRIDALHDEIFARLTSGAVKLPVDELVRWLTVAGRLERVSDQARAVCQEALFVQTGSTGPKRLYRILFADAGDGLASRLAQALAEERYGRVASFKSASSRPQAAVNPRLVESGREVDTSPPRALPDLAAERFDVVIALAPEASPALGAIPFHTVRQTWPLHVEDTDLDDVLREIETRLDRLMNLLCEDATSR
ncbi:MAG: hypothetical protein EP330_03090 [Deltaproteobacteria bacterium]|nr:MAG: hypothetical protein EP330_03090 [Deltaproteobacteria bacterium]